VNICVFDTETTSLDKPFCYNVGYCIVDTETGKNLVERDFVVEQIWHNPELFCSAYYADKRPIYISAMRSKKTVMDKFGYVCQQMIRDFKYFDVSFAYAYNSNFDERVFNFNCDWFKCCNPFDNIQIYDIRDYAIKFFCDNQYKDFCERNEYFTDSLNYSTTAEVMYRYLTSNTDFIEDHTALSDSKIETEILLKAIEAGADITEKENAPKSVKRKIKKTLHIVDSKKVSYYFDYESMRMNKERTEIKLK